ncbi:hypothetical protein [Geodermatophilus marinus]|uniref:hypothetical protein n=1 Tax=Geodermatophilus sp. LHW52908 TaxID=2303986 RepID=UPI0011C16348|nr:hypothetical protein [Geodermatophilus sp. LHW52908]
MAAERAGMEWLVLFLAVWVALAVAVAVLVGRGIRMADARSAGTGTPLTTADLPAGMVAVGSARR